jgi:hypothetical protein
MNSTLSFIWKYLNEIGNIPDELIVKILYEFNGFRHPIVTILLKETKNNTYENLQTYPFSKSIEKYYNKHGCTKKLIDLVSNKQNNYFRFEPIASYIYYNDPGYFMPRQFGKLYYSIFNDTMKWNLHRSKHILDNIKCFCNKSYSNTNNINNHSSYVEALKYVENNILTNNKWMCKYCYNIAFNEYLPIVQ